MDANILWPTAQSRHVVPPSLHSSGVVTCKSVPEQLNMNVVTWGCNGLMVAALSWANKKDSL